MLYWNPDHELPHFFLLFNVSHQEFVWFIMIRARSMELEKQRKAMSFGREYLQDFQVYSFCMVFFQHTCIVFNMSHTLLSAEGIDETSGCCLSVLSEQIDCAVSQSSR